MRHVLLRTSGQQSHNVHVGNPGVVERVVVWLAHGRAVIKQTLRDYGGRHAASRSARENIYLETFTRRIVRISPLVMLSDRIEYFKCHARFVAPQRNSACDCYRQFLGHRTILRKRRQKSRHQGSSDVGTTKSDLLTLTTSLAEAIGERKPPSTPNAFPPSLISEAAPGEYTMSR